MQGISVIIPSYNRKKMLGRALASVCNQSRSCDEIIVVDDGSTDGTGEYVEKMALQSKIPIHYFYQDNRGPAAARNLGIRNAHHALIAFLDSDDYWHRQKLELQCAILEKNPEMMISHTKEKWLRRGKHLNQKKKHQPGNGDIFKHCLQLCAVGMSTVVLRKKLFADIGLFNEELRCCEDYDLWIRTSCQYPFLLVEEPLTIKEGGREDQVSYTFRVGMDRFRVTSLLNLLQSKVLNSFQQQLCLVELKKKSVVYGRGCMKHNKEEEGKKYLAIANWAAKQVENE